MNHISVEQKKLPLNSILFQYIEKHHAEQMIGRKMSDDEWERFVRRFQNHFGELSSELASEFLQTWEEEE